LKQAGYTIEMERSPNRIFDEAGFEAVGTTLVPEGFCVDAPKDNIIVGVRDLEEKNCES